MNFDKSCILFFSWYTVIMQSLGGFLSLEERRELRSVLHRSGHSAREHGRANAILLLDEGVPLPLVAKLLFLDDDTVRNFLDRYRAGKTEALFDDKREGKSPKLSDSQRERLEKHLDEHLY
ncbi:MAG: helix-turn-helix domain-containing protein, partial [Planctomycetota bacterium]|nr:helix-turn-helix domain-containing protein [Planctomycetota bacterium]